MRGTRRELIFGAGAALVGAARGARAEDHPLASFDREMERFMQERGVPGGSLAVVKDGRLVYARGYGWADREKREPVQPDSLFRIASISKPVTGAAVMKLVGEGRLNLDTRAFDLVRLPAVVPKGKSADPRVRSVTVRQLLHHTGGWDRDKSYDPMFRALQIAREVGVEAPAGADAVIRYMLGQPLDFDPGTRYAYSNFGYCVLGRVVEAVTRMSYEEYVRREVLAPLGITRMRIGATRERGRAPGEVRYYMPDGEKFRSVFPDVQGAVDWPYGGFYLEAMDSHGGWIASAVDLVRFMEGVDGRRPSRVLSSTTIREMYARPAAPVWRKEDGSPTDTYYGCGWSVRPVGLDGEKSGRANYWHMGSLPGTNTLLVRRWDGLTWAALFNLRSRDEKLPDSAIDGALHRAAADVTEWPSKDLFPRFR
ncbi:MAG: serine hydrolase domain-containing protein [Armatimonadota bacterium]